LTAAGAPPTVFSVTSTIKDAAADQTPYHIRSDSSLSTGRNVPAPTCSVT
jgi:hypothetical protein